MSSHIIVCIKSVVRSAPAGIARRTPQNSELNPFDRPALEAALQIKEARGGTITALTMGPDVSAEALKEAQAMGADEAVLISDPALAGSDTLITSQVLAAAIERLAPFDLVLFGTRTSDSDTGQVGPQTASLMEIPFVGGVKTIDPNDEGWDVQRIMDDWQERWQVRSPAAATIHPRAFSPRAIALADIGQAHDNPSVQSWDLAALKLDPQQVGLAGSPTRVANLQKIKRRRTCQMVSGEPQEQVEALVAHLTKIGVMGS